MDETSSAGGHFALVDAFSEAEQPLETDLFSSVREPSKVVNFSAVRRSNKGGLSEVQTPSTQFGQ